MFERFKAHRRLAEVEEAVAKLQRDHKALEAEWSNAWDKLRRMMMRTAKRAEVVEKSDDDPQSSMLPAQPQARPGTLTERQREIQLQIMRRRAGG